MRDLLAAPDQFDWLVTRLEIARKLRNDPAFHQGWAERSGRVVGGDHRTSAQAEAGRHACAMMCRVRCCRPIWIWSSTVWWRALASGEDTENLSAVLDLVEDSVRHPAGGG